MNYKEATQSANKYKQNYIDGLNNLIEQRQKEAEIIRQKYIENIFSNQEKYRDDFKEMLGWPLVGYDSKKETTCQSEKLSDEEGYSIFRMQFEILDGVQLTGLLFKAETDEKKPLVIVQHGGGGTPELISGILGDTANYNDMLMRVRKYGVHIFAPQLLLWKEDTYEVKHDRRETDAKLKGVGSSLTAIEIFGIMKILDYFENMDYVSTFGMVGLSYGGFYTLFTSAIDTRIKSAISCAFFNSRDKVGWPDWVWQDSSKKFDDAEVACLVYPRHLCIEIADNDELFDYNYGIKSFNKVKELAKDVGTDWIDLILFEGTHEFHKNDEPIEQLIEDLI